MSFFIKSKNNSRLGIAEKKFKGNNVKRKIKNSEGVLKKKKKNKFDDEEIESSEDEAGRPERPPPAAESEDDAEETSQEKRLRLAKLYLSELEKEEAERREGQAPDRDLIARRLKEGVLEQSGRLRRTVADEYAGPDLSAVALLRCKQQSCPLTCLVLSADNTCAFAGAKNGSIVKWSLDKRVKETCILGLRKNSPKDQVGHKKPVLCLAISTDSHFLASGGEDCVIHVWKPGNLQHIHSFQDHRGSVTGLAFQHSTHQLFSCSRDKSVKVWNLSEMCYVETLFGHQADVTAIDALHRERALSAGGRDGTVRLWKIVEESQLIFNGHKGSIDSVKLINEDHFITCGDDGQLCLWGNLKKKPLCIVNNAHGISESNEEANWVSSIAALVNTDLVASGSHDGHVRLWKCGSGFRELTCVMQVPVTGFVNALCFTSDGSHLIAAVSKEHRFGRWWTIKEAKNAIVIIPLLKK
ncbi:U3 small nucleolar RNA-interacting protein 2 [Bacillus rossius redtenbacheri]|uniref:U3 small nucleolar RNA-interacting protein 2 n=1 Tax=Bacillus rossius redtenbacheri TaxID=93214 RepID=UPI002FDD9022